MNVPRPKSRSKRGARGVRRRLVASAKNALELMRFGRLGEAYGAPYEVVDVGPHHRLRRYVTTEDPLAPPALFVPPLMVTSEIYDLAADTSAVASFGERGIQPFVLDFGAPERESGGLERTLDDHVKAVVRAIERVRELTGRDVHLLGYSQGGMFCYQAAAYVQGKGLKSVVTFGSPVDIHKGSPIRNDVASALVHTLEPALAKILGGVESLPSKVTSLGFKLVSTRKEIEQRLQFLASLHDRQALVRREARRRFLNGEGFVAWPGPAFQRFVEDFVVHNRMLAGGFVIDGRTVTLADIRCPILAFIGAHDEIARPAAVRAIAEAAPNADVSIVTAPAGHFGIVVGSQAMARTWPHVAKWIYFHEGRGPAPTELPEVDPALVEDEYDAAEFDVEFNLLLDTVKSRAGGLVKRVLDWTSSASDTLDAVRYQEPRLRELERITSDTAISAARVLRERAAATPEATFFLWHGRAFSYADADRRVTNVARGLIACGVKKGDKVGVLMASRPSFLSVVTALSRLGAIPVVAAPDSDPGEVKRAFADEGTSFVVSDPEHGESWRRALGTKILVLGGGSRRTVAPGLFDMEAVDPSKVELPEGTTFDDSRARDLAFVLLRPNDRGALRAARITNHRWALSAMGAAAACTIKPSDTVYTSVPLHHPTGIVVSAGAALVGGARLALGARFEPSLFLEEVRRVGATIVFYAGEMLRPLLFEPPRRGDKSLPIRLFAGSGMREDLVVRLRERFGVNSLEFYAGTQHHAILANASGEKPGALGRVLPGSADVTLVAVDLTTRAPSRAGDGHLVRVDAGKAGLLVVRSEPDAAAIDPTTEGTFDGNDRWVITGDVLRQDDGGDYWFVDAASGFVLRDGTAVSTREVESAFYTLPEVRLVAVVRDEESLVAVIEGSKITAERLEEVALGLPAPARPDVVRVVATLPNTEGYRPDRKAAVELEPTQRFVWNAASNEYRAR